MILHGCATKGFATPQFQEMCSELAQHGYYTMFIEYYGRAGTPNCSDLAMTPTDSLEPNIPLPDDIWMRDLISARDSLAQDPKADTKRLGIIGFSFGGTLAVITAALNPGVISTIVDYYGYSNERVEDAVAHVVKFPPTLILQGDEDRRAHVTDSIHLHKVIANRQPETEIHVYPGVEHAFNFHDAVGYDHAASVDAWSRTLRFLDMELK
jgi:carboxymethylenebutenolidase